MSTCSRAERVNASSAGDEQASGTHLGVAGNKAAVSSIHLDTLYAHKPSREQHQSRGNLQHPDQHRACGSREVKIAIGLPLPLPAPSAAVQTSLVLWCRCELRRGDKSTFSMTSKNASRWGIGMNHEMMLVKYARSTPAAAGRKGGLVQSSPLCVSSPQQSKLPCPNDARVRQALQIQGV